MMVTADGHVKLVDFGTCKDLIETDLNGGEFVGTAQYMSPQAVASEDQVGCSLGKHHFILFLA